MNGKGSCSAPDPLSLGFSARSGGGQRVKEGSRGALRASEAGLTADDIPASPRFLSSALLWMLRGAREVRAGGGSSFSMIHLGGLVSSLALGAESTGPVFGGGSGWSWGQLLPAFCLLLWAPQGGRGLLFHSCSALYLLPLPTTPLLSLPWVPASSALEPHYHSTCHKY